MVNEEGERPTVRGPLDELWTNLLSPFFGIQPRHDSPNSSEKPLRSAEHELLEDSLRELIGKQHYNACRLKESVQSCDEEAPLPFTTPSRVCQLESWDCGIACIMMILRWIQNSLDPSLDRLPVGTSAAMSDQEAQTYRNLRDAIHTQSIWTADLVLQLEGLLRNSNTRYLFCSTTFQVEQDYRNVSYYRAAFGRDEQRVTSIFSKLHADPSTNLFCAPQGIPLDVILNAVCHSNCMALVLVDNAVLRNRSDDSMTYYVGHYVLLCGLSRDPKHLAQAQALESNSIDANNNQDRSERLCVVLCDPGQHRPSLSFVTPKRFERARRAKGTDEDIIFFAKSMGKVETIE